ncbi:hypothetical protein TEA_016830 [Camellia sinensis var. sinensis]|uniref:Uncharacterized protein n=1 Tax=Camellia sinensis var. sinensis TaxID=542762 RepID=A0A4S4DFV4_CAMSN|nr:hypothetical protein TEA_016830 [Camellia sinensis var. sinensis]
MKCGLAWLTTLKVLKRGCSCRNDGGGAVAIAGCEGYSVMVAKHIEREIDANGFSNSPKIFEALGRILKEVFCLGVTAGAYILTLFAMKYRERVRGLILVSPVCKAPSWTEWLYNKVLLNLLYFYGMCGLLKECLLHRYFSKELRSSMNGAESDVIQACRRVQSCGSLVTEEHPYAMLIPIEFFLMGFGLYRQQLPLSAASSNGSNPAKPPSVTYSCIAPELLSPESLGIKLKPIKTRATIEI